MALFGPTLEKIHKWVEAGNASKLISVLNSNDAALRQAAIAGLARLRSPEVLEYCRKNARHTDQKVRWCITQILGLIGTPGAMHIMETVCDPADRLKKSVRPEIK